jgi:hypothetical protein
MNKPVNVLAVLDREAKELDEGVKRGDIALREAADQKEASMIEVIQDSLKFRAMDVREARAAVMKLGETYLYR